MNKKFRLNWETICLTALLVLSAILSLANLSIEGYANTYYSAGVKSMLQSFKNFFFVSFDPSGFVSIDKPPVGFWLQAISAKIFGFSGFSVILPQAIAGVLSVFIVYRLVKRNFGAIPALISGLCLSITPIFVAASRNNTIDNLLVLALLICCYPLFKAAEEGKLKYLILCLIILGIGFNIKMVEAYLIAPAIYITYFLSSKLTYKKKLKHLFLGSAVLLVVSFSWAVIVDLIPSTDRPFVGSSTNNTVTQLIIGHNGLERVGLNNILNKTPQKKTAPKDKNPISKNSTKSEKNLTLFTTNEKADTTPTINQNAMNTISKTGITRLFHYDNLSDQISWLLPFAIIGFIAASVREKLRYPFDNPRKLSLIFWFAWLLTEFAYFSFSRNVTHSYYLTTMAPPIAALTGIGLEAMMKLFKESSWKRWFLPVAFMLNGIIEVIILYPNFSKSDGYKFTGIETAILCIGCSIVLAVLAAGKVASTSNEYAPLSKLVIIIAFVGTLTAPLIWSFTTLFYPLNGSSPYAGLEIVSKTRSRSTDFNNIKKLVQFLETNKGNEQYLVAVPSANTYASDLILKTGEPIMTIGGYSGGDKILSLKQFKDFVASGKLRYAIVSNNGRMRSTNNDIMNWIKTNGKLVPDNQWNNSSSSNSKTNNRSFNGATGDQNQLYDLSKLASR
ncbi:glycosyltransferase family 39 protein [Clostridium manihotivorum]|uniref:Dolichyl-phosphate-mannose--protein mannosyltransferase n=1 Tax=Clostridium manihotivorum TaxID=2320868 RepID=A0A3R5QXG2_9CLOT|nr:glycosyltransferase family 39 protein [Clostridium manihotivorum]QAA34514.1 dolichyl-phosphate-mannose--protein mannosyltransferase [Clostridium manihotivorum]